MFRDLAAELLTFYISMSNGWVVELFSASGVCPRSGWQNFFPESGKCQFRMTELFPESGTCQCQRSRFLTCFSCMSSVFEEELCSASGAWSVSRWTKPVLLQGMSVSGIRISSCIRVCPVSGRQKSIIGFGRMQWRTGRTSCCVRCMYSGAWWQNLSCFGGISRGRVAELCPASGVCPVTEWQNSVLRQGYFRGSGSQVCPASGVCIVP
ncbi:hypothetical protein TNIN_428691 [Trichonephila inaurata madagascariensis]|uniref:Uncharacterized protein n=1 Tax=Trichonephila inaurata madagascariensis TaxID=2747483 RepID=A0A8X7CRA9_9ARAC|nr:hypothetical protein TNIN_428691 [Trichonephila inaurata madagascariensis]